MALITKTLILDHRQINQKIRRMAYQIYEYNSNETEIIIAGIMTSGYRLAERIGEVLDEISDIEVLFCRLQLNKKDPLAGVESSIDQAVYSEKVVVVVDDVLNSGSTLMHGVQHFMSVPLKKLQTVVLVDRSHKKFPIKADFKGISLSTSLKDTVTVSFGEKDKAELH